MRWPRVRITIGRMMIAVAIVALVTAIVLAIPPTIDPLLRERGLRLGVVTYPVVFILLTCAVAVPVITGLALAFDAVSRARAGGRPPLRRLLLGIVLFVWGMSIAFRPLPLDGLRQAGRLDAETFVAFYHQYRLWPGRHVTPCLEIISRDGDRTTYPLNLARSCFNVNYRTNADRTMIWAVEVARPPAHSGEVLCSLDLARGEFISAPGPFPSGVGVQGGFPF